ncbi:MAG: CPBP family intramembrane glutamic endopeptidase [Candidatus Aminicenantales bacterium]
MNGHWDLLLSIAIITSPQSPLLSSWLNLVLCIPAMFLPFLLLSPLAFLIGWINHLGEEFAWRGFLFRKIVEEGGSLISGIFISGITWWAWHLPLFLFSPVLSRLNWGQTLLTLFLSVFSILGTAVIYSWIYFKSASIWAPTIMHIFWNLYRAILTGRLADGEPGLFKGDLWLINGEGIIGMAVTSLFGLCFLPLIMKIDRNRVFKKASSGLGG